MPDAIHVGFGFTYDVSCMLQDLSRRQFQALRSHNKTMWRGYRIEHVPRKWFKVSKGGVSIRIYDVVSFFGCALVEALETWKIGPFEQTATAPSTLEWSPSVMPSASALAAMDEETIVRIFKQLRSEFQWEDISQIRTYMRLELKYTVVLMNKLREVLRSADYEPTSWHGPGAVARMALRRHRVYVAMAVSPPAVQEAARYGFFGGRFEPFYAGQLGGPVYIADINSAYPYAATLLPNLARGVWRYSKDFVPGKFAIWDIEYTAETLDVYAIHPLPCRTSTGHVVFPPRVVGWYWSPEVEEALSSPGKTRVLGGWVFEEDNPGDRPFAFIADYYRIRQKLKTAENPAEWVFKLIINSIYGQLAQRVGWNKNTGAPPQTHQLEWAGYITSVCRAMVYRLARTVPPKSVISIDTDGVTCTVPPPVTASKALGQWSVTQYDDGIFWQSGIYVLRTSKGWTKAKSRGIGKGTGGYSHALLSDALDSGAALKMSKRVFHSYGLALQKGNAWRDTLNTWDDEPHEFVMGGQGKRYHPQFRGKCPDACSPRWHPLAFPVMKYIKPGEPLISQPHELPWLDMDDKKKFMIELTLYDTNDGDLHEEWSM